MAETDKVGTCLCGAVEVTCASKPEMVAICYCESCQKTSAGGSSCNLALPQGNVRITKGAPKTYMDTSDAGNEVRRQFCGDCGCAIMTMSPAYPGLAIVKAGLFSHVKDMQVAISLWTKSRPDWAPIHATAPQFPDNPPAG